MSKRTRGFMLVLCLLLATLILVIGMGMLGKSLLAYRGAVQAGNVLQARLLAEMGLEDVMQKLWKDPLFPPRGDLTQQTFTYTEDMTISGGVVVGTYTVTVDTTFQVPYPSVITAPNQIPAPYNIIRITCIGTTFNGTLYRLSQRDGSGQQTALADLTRYL